MKALNLNDIAKLAAQLNSLWEQRRQSHNNLEHILDMVDNCGLTQVYWIERQRLEEEHGVEISNKIKDIWNQLIADEIIEEVKEYIKFNQLN